MVEISSEAGARAERNSGHVLKPWISFKPVRSGPARVRACLNGVSGCRIRHHVDWSRPDAPHERDRDAEMRA
jgi:hypothetical protein